MEQQVRWTVVLRWQEATPLHMQYECAEERISRLACCYEPTCPCSAVANAQPAIYPRHVVCLLMTI